MSTIEIRDEGLGRIPRAMPRDRATEARLIARSKAGDRLCYDQLVDGYRVELNRFLSSRTDARDVEDLLQDAFLAAWTAIGNYDGRAPFRTWLYAIAMNKLRDHFRQRSRMVREVELLHLDQSAGASESAYAATEWTESVKDLLVDLPASQLEVIMLYYHDGFTLAEISAILQRNRNTVKYQFFQAHNRLANAIQKSPAWRSLGVGLTGGKR